MYGREIVFKVAGKDFSADALHVVIPVRYVDLFDGHEFESMHELSMALMYASCAKEALDYGEILAAARHDRTLRNILGIR